MPIDTDAIRKIFSRIDSLDRSIGEVKEFLTRLDRDGVLATTVRAGSSIQSTYQSLDIKIPFSDIQRYVMNRLNDLTTRREAVASELQLQLVPSVAEVQVMA